MRHKRILATLSGSAVAGLFGVAAYAANPEPVVVEVEFVEPITITETSALQFGLLDVNMANGDTVTIAPNGTVSESAANVLAAAVAPAAALTVTATPGALIDIQVGTITGNTGYTLAGFQCDYNGGGAGGCQGAPMSATAAASATLNIGATLTGTGAAVVGQSYGSFEVTISYQ